MAEKMPYNGMSITHSNIVQLKLTAYNMHDNFKLGCSRSAKVLSIHLLVKPSTDRTPGEYIVYIVVM